MCFASFLWFRNEKEILRKMLLTESFKEVNSSEFADLDVNSSLMKAIQRQLRGMDYPQDLNMKLTDNELQRYQHLVAFYQKMYIDAFVVTNQCKMYETLAENKTEKVEKPKQDIFEYGPEKDPSEILIFIAYNNWARNDRDFKQDPNNNVTDWKYVYRDISKDSLRCYLLYMPMHLVKYLAHQSQKPKDSLDKSECFNYIIFKMKLLKFGIQMLNKSDLHTG
jgi:hypothetical protein